MCASHATNSVCAELSVVRHSPLFYTLDCSNCDLTLLHAHRHCHCCGASHLMHIVNIVYFYIASVSLRHRVTVELSAIETQIIHGCQGPMFVGRHASLVCVCYQTTSLRTLLHISIASV